MNISKALGLTLLALLVSCLLLGCSKQEPTPTEAPPPTAQTDQNAESTPVEEATKETETSSVVILVADQITTLDPYRMVSTHPEGSLASHLWDTLTLLNDSLQIEPHLAESWRLINNFTWEVRLRQGITFHNGEPLDAEAVRFSIERAQSMQDSLETFAQDIFLDKVEILDEHTLRLVTARPVSNLPHHLAFLEILPPIYYSETDPNQLATAPAGSGPYQVKEWIPGEAIVLEAVPTYWKGVPTWSRLTFQSIPDAQDRLQALRNGEATLVTDLPPIQAAEWDIADSRLEAIESTQRMLIGMHVQEDSPLANRRVRQALNYGVNVAQIAEDWLQGYGERYGSWVNPPANNVELLPWPYDPDLSRELLAEAGYPEGFVTTLHTPNGVYYQDVAIAQAIAQQLGLLGITVEVEAVDWNTYTVELLSDAPPPLFLLGMNSRGNALEEVKQLSSDFAFNPTGWQNQSFEEVVRRAENSFNENARSRLLDEAQDIAYQEAPCIWLWRQYDFYGVVQNLDWVPRADGLVYLYKAQAQSTEATN